MQINAVQNKIFCRPSDMEAISLEDPKKDFPELILVLRVYVVESWPQHQLIHPGRFM